MLLPTLPLIWPVPYVDIVPLRLNLPVGLVALGAGMGGWLDGRLGWSVLSRLGERFWAGEYVGGAVGRLGAEDVRECLACGLGLEVAEKVLPFFLLILQNTIKPVFKEHRWGHLSSEQCPSYLLHVNAPATKAHLSCRDTFSGILRCPLKTCVHYLCVNGLEFCHLFFTTSLIYILAYIILFLIDIASITLFLIYISIYHLVLDLH